MQPGLIQIAQGLDPGPLLESLADNQWLWNEITDRQHVPGTPHGETETIFLRWCETRTLDAVFAEIPAIDYPALQFLPEARPLIGKVLELANATELGRVLLVSLKPGGRIIPHADEGAYADHYERFHLSLYSHPGNTIAVAASGTHGQFVTMRPGELWWFNHKSRHWAFNDSKEPRIHMIVDCVAKRFRQEREE